MPRISFAYLPMRAFPILLVPLLSIANLGWSQVSVPSTHTANLPLYRPILLGNGPDALINRIDTQDLIKNGQKDAAIMFCCSVKKNGEVAWSGTYRGTTGSKLLEQEVLKELSPAANTRFIPAVYNHLPVDALYFGTVTFALVDGKPRLRIFSNQELGEVQKENDFIAPQPFFGGESGFTVPNYPRDTAPVDVNGVVELEVKVDATGNLQDLKVISENPPFLGFADAAFDAYKKAKFVPAFRDGKPVASDVKVPVFFREKGF